MSVTKPVTWIKRPAVLLFLVTLLVRFWVISRLTNNPLFDPNGGDMKFYNEWALRILRGQFSDGHAFYGLPGYPFLMAGIYKVFGYNPFYLSCLQAVAEAFTATFIYLIGRTAFRTASDPGFGGRIGLLASLGYAFFIPAETFSVILMPTSLLVALFWAIVFWAVRDHEKNISPGKIACLGVAIGAMAMIVATIFFIIPIVFVKFWLAGKRDRFNSLVLRVGLLAVAVVLGCSPAILHNRLVAHDSVLLSAHSGLNFFVGNNPEANGYPKIPAGLSANQAGMLSDSITIAEKALGATPANPIKRSAVSLYWSAKASAYIHDNPGAWFQLLGQKIKNFWNAYQYDDLTLINLFADEGITTPGIRYGLISALGLGATIFAGRAYPKSCWIIAAILLHMGSLLTVFVTERYRMAAAPGLLLLSSFFVWHLHQQITKTHWKQAGAMLLAVAASTWFVTIPPKDRGIAALEAYNSGILNIDFNRLDLAEKQLLFALSQVPDNDEVNFALGRLYLAKQNDQLAKNYFRSTLECNPGHDRAMSNLGAIALRQKMPAVAEKFLKKSLVIEPDSALSHFLLAQSLFQQAKPNEALEEVDVALKAFPNNKEFLELKEKIVSATKAALP